MTATWQVDASGGRKDSRMAYVQLLPSFPGRAFEAGGAASCTASVTPLRGSHRICGHSVPTVPARRESVSFSLACLDRASVKDARRGVDGRSTARQHALLSTLAP